MNQRSNEILRLYSPGRILRNKARNWALAGTFATGLWDSTSRSETYKIINHPQYSGRLIPNEKDLISSMVQEGLRIRLDAKSSDKFLREESRKLILVIKNKN